MSATIRPPSTSPCGRNSTQTAPPESWRRDLLALSDARTAYEERFGWQTTIEPGRRRITILTGTNLDAIAMPADLGHTVTHGLVAMMQPAAVLATGEGRWLTVLTAPRPTAAGLPADLDHAHVRLLPTRTPLVLPVPGRPTGEVRWLMPPRPGAGLPAHSVVITLARRASRAVST